MEGDNPCSLGDSVSSRGEVNLSKELGEMFPRHEVEVREEEQDLGGWRV